MIAIYITMKIITEKNNIVEKAGITLNDMFKERNGKPLLMLLSGGSSLNLLDHVEQDSLGPDVTVGMLDDRFTRDTSINSCALIKGQETGTSFYTKVLAAETTFLDSYPDQLDTLETYAEKYESFIKKWMKLYPDGIIRATVGIGPDGHTSGILPHPESPEKFEKLFNGERLIVGYDVENKNPHRYRMTSTFTLMRKFDQVLTFMQGENKKEALQKVMAEEGSLAETPGRIVRELKNVTIFTDIEI
jgi:6-phosphogluconolactonase/glucosamine-6-phosphate isomerase/deaminase